MAKMKRRNFLKLFGGSAALVNFTDFAEFAKHWLETKDVEDLAEFADNWLTEKDAPLQDKWTISFFWRPESSSRELHGHLPIALIKGIDGGFLALKYEILYYNGNRSGGQFVLNDGTHQTEITADQGWKFADTLKFALAREGDNTNIYIETPADGTLKNKTANGITLSSAVRYVKFSANSDNEIKGIGAYGDVKMYDSTLADTDVQKIFDLSSDVPNPIITHTTETMLFERNSERYGAKPTTLEEIEANKPLVKTVASGGRIKVFNYEADEGSTYSLRWTDNDKAYVRESNQRRIAEYCP